CRNSKLTHVGLALKTTELRNLCDVVPNRRADAVSGTRLLTLYTTAREGATLTTASDAEVGSQMARFAQLMCLHSRRLGFLFCRYLLLFLRFLFLGGHHRRNVVNAL